MEQYTKTPLHLQNFTVTNTYSRKSRGVRTFYVCGHLTEEIHKKICHCCGYQNFYSNWKRTIKLKHASIADFQIVVEVEYTRWECQTCYACFRSHIPFKEKGHRITKLFMRQLLDKLGNGNTVLRTARELHSNRNLVKNIDKERLRKIAGDMKPTHFSPFISVDEWQRKLVTKNC